MHSVERSVYKKVRKLVISLLLICIINFGCAYSRSAIKCPSSPQMMPVAVRHGSISGQSLDNAIENHQALWQHIHILEKSNCRAH